MVLQYGVIREGNVRRIAVVVMSFATLAIGADPLLYDLVGQTCRGNTGLFDVAYTIDLKNGRWAVHDVFGAKGSPTTDVGWRPASADGNKLTFQGMSAQITLAAKDAHTVDGHFMQTNPSRPGVYDYTLTCSPTPAEQRWH